MAAWRQPGNNGNNSGRGVISSGGSEISVSKEKGVSGIGRNSAHNARRNARSRRA
jgi:hypothetical protein